MRDPIYVNRSFIPPLEEVYELMKGIWEKGQLTNNGPLLLDMEHVCALT